MKDSQAPFAKPLPGLTTLQLVITVTRADKLTGDRFYFRATRASRITIGPGHDEDVTLERALVNREDVAVVFRRLDGFYLAQRGLESRLQEGGRFTVGRCELEFGLQEVPLVVGHGREMPHEGGLGSFYNNAKRVLKRFGMMGG